MRDVELPSEDDPLRQLTAWLVLSWDEDSIDAAMMTGRNPRTGRALSMDDIEAFHSAMQWRVAVEKGNPNAMKVLARKKKMSLRANLKRKGKLRKGQVFALRWPLNGKTNSRQSECLIERGFPSRLNHRSISCSYR